MKPLHFFLVLSGILFFAAVIRLFNLSQPTGYYFDEQYHVPAAKLAQAGDPHFYEWWHGSMQEDPDCIHSSDPSICVNNYDWLHPPLGKYFQAMSMAVFGQTEVGWRMSSVVFGVLVIAATFGLAYSLFKNMTIALLASFFVAIDGLMITQSRIAMNDIQLTLWVVLALWSYSSFRNAVHKKWLLLLTGVFLGCTVATKWSGFFVLLGILIFELYRIFSVSKIEVKKISQPVSPFSYSLAKTHWVVFSILIVPFIMYVFMYLPMFFQGKSVGYFFEYHSQILQYQLYGASDHPYASHPLQWISNTKPVLYWRNQEGSISAFGNPVLHVGAIISVIASCIYVYSKYISKKKGGNYFQLIFLLGMYISIWLPWFFSPRISFYYHYSPAVPILAALVAYWVYWLSGKKIPVGRFGLSGKAISIGFFVLLCISFMLSYSYWTGLPVSKLLGLRVYFMMIS